MGWDYRFDFQQINFSINCPGDFLQHQLSPGQENYYGTKTMFSIQTQIFHYCLKLS